MKYNKRPAPTNTTDAIGATTSIVGEDSGSGSDIVKKRVCDLPMFPDVSVAQTVRLCIPTDKNDNVVFPAIVTLIVLILLSLQ